MYYYIYKTTNNLNGKYYIGKCCSKTIIKNWYYGGGIKIRQAIEKHGVENFSREILLYCFTREDLLFYESVYVTENEVNDPLCYNMVLGGGGTHGYAHTENTKQKISNAQRNKIISPEHRHKISSANKGRAHSRESNELRSKSAINKPKTCEHSQNISAGRKKWHETHIMYNANPITHNGIIYPSISEACRALNVKSKWSLLKLLELT